MRLEYMALKGLVQLVEKDIAESKYSENYNEALRALVKALRDVMRFM